MAARATLTPTMQTASQNFAIGGGRIACYNAPFGGLLCRFIMLKYQIFRQRV